MAVQKKTGTKTTAKKAPAKASATKGKTAAKPAAKASAAKASSAKKSSSDPTPSDAYMSAWRRIVAMAWEDAGFLEQLRKNPKKFLAANGVKVSPGVSYVIHEDTRTTRNIVIPCRKDDEDEDDNGGKGGKGGKGDDENECDPSF